MFFNGTQKVTFKRIFLGQFSVNNLYFSQFLVSAVILSFFDLYTHDYHMNCHKKMQQGSEKNTELYRNTEPLLNALLSSWIFMYVMNWIVRPDARYWRGN